MKNDILRSSIMGSVPFAVLGGLFTLASPYMKVWCLAMGFCIAYCANLKFKDLIDLALSLLVGIIWAFAFWYSWLLFLHIEMGQLPAMLFSLLIVNAALLYVHTRFLHNTPLRRIPLHFPAIFSLFECGADMTVYPFMLLAIFIGASAALVSGPFADLFKSKTASADQET
jgi:hypothetical protein